MICPIMSHEVKVSKEKVVLELANCLERRCAWWNVAYSCCELAALVSSIRLVSMRLHDIEEKMPHAGQFVK